MGFWGMGLTQSDEFCEVYEAFMTEYNKGKSVEEISNSILNKYHTEFDDTDGIIHDVYFALAKAEWICCKQSALILNRVCEIIESGENIRFYHELGATEKDLKKRQDNLERFWISIQIPKEKPRKRRLDPLDREKELPQWNIGECFRYKYDGRYRVFAVLGFNKSEGWRDMMRCAIFKKTYSISDLTTHDFLNEPIYSISCYLGEELPCTSSVKMITVISVPERFHLTSRPAFELKFGYKKDFKALFTDSNELFLTDSGC